MITSLKAKLSKAEYERGVYKQQLDAALKRIEELENHNEFKEAAEAEPSTPCECESLKAEIDQLKKDNHSLKTKVGMLSKKPKAADKTKKATANK
ncbi:hypothetical protein [Desulfovibrio gilichinskyi]|uniref:Uncharacterized protein n=1 Tax=Desulfovibrio gilichinskyi TaxID=1519643 RepID=A0A1X7C3Y1_9BACT|nr:hypothetical protein [Desulfovibrio gilichinskyi]SME89393.1 hypothetical protein SAMN06295933_0292 [Desulfovibrio gilichinskyi]